MWDEYWEDRGSPWEHDPGPAKNRRWSRLFAETPNYRGFGKALSGSEEFRWHFGPMFYRGRLGDNQVKVLIVGQEGAQDESLSHRSFTGGTGARMQHLLTHLGIDRSYLFLNTFVYPIFDQYNGLLPTIAQHPASPIARHRTEILDYAAERNDLQLAIAVGRAAKESLASWVEAHGGTADPDKLHLADASVISPHLRMVGVLHPGGAAQGGAVAGDHRQLQGRDHQGPRVGRRRPGVAPGRHRGDARAAPRRTRTPPTRSRSATSRTARAWRLGRGGTSSNRRDNQRGDPDLLRARQVQQRRAHPVVPGQRRRHPDRLRGAARRSRLGAATAGARRLRPRPGTKFAQLLQGGLAGFAWPDFNSFGLKCEASFGTGPIFRGRLDKPSILVLADQESHDDLFTMRASTGDAGQHLQAFLTAAGVTERYGILRVLPVDTLGDDQSHVEAAVDSPAGPGALRRGGPPIRARRCCCSSVRSPSACAPT